MTIAFVSSTVSSATALATACPVAWPASIAFDDGLVLMVATKPFNATISPPSGWNLLGSQTNGTTAQSTDTGSMLIAGYFWRALGGETGNVTVNIGSANSSWAVICRYTKAANTVWQTAWAGGTDTTAGASWSVAFGANPGITNGDYVVLGAAIPTDAANTWSAHSLSATSLTMSTPVNRQTPLITTGNDCGGHVASAFATAGTSASIPTWTATQTLATNNAGAAGLVRLREVVPPVRVPVPVVVAQQARRRQARW